MISETSFEGPLESPEPHNVIAAIKKTEQQAQQKLTEQSRAFDDQLFRQLRRALPKTRSKMDWEKVEAYRVGSGQAITE